MNLQFLLITQGYDFECSDDTIVDGYLFDGTINCVPREEGFCREGSPYK